MVNVEIRDWEKRRKGKFRLEGKTNKQSCKAMALKTMFSDHELFHLFCKDKVNILSSTSDLGTGYSNEYSKVTG